jgi:hypothetical protein
MAGNTASAGSLRRRDRGEPRATREDFRGTLTGRAPNPGDEP